MNEHQMYEMTRRQFNAICAERDALTEQRKELVIERDALRKENERLHADLDKLHTALDKTVHTAARWRKAYYGDYHEEPNTIIFEIRRATDDALDDGGDLSAEHVIDAKELGF